MRIEMFGPPTSGKSTVVRQLSQFGVACGQYGDENEIPPEWKWFSKRVRMAFLDRKVFKKQLEKLPGKSLAALAGAYAADQVKYPVVCDEFVAMCGLSMAIRSWKDCIWYFEDMPLPSLLVVLNAPFEVLVQRNLQRGVRSRVKKTERTLPFLAAALEILKRRGCRVMEFDTSVCEPVDIAMAVVAEVHRIVSDGSP